MFSLRDYFTCLLEKELNIHQVHGLFEYRPVTPRLHTVHTRKACPRFGGQETDAVRVNAIALLFGRQARAKCCAFTKLTLLKYYIEYYA